MAERGAMVVVMEGVWGYGSGDEGACGGMVVVMEGVWCNGSGDGGSVVQWRR